MALIALVACGFVGCGKPLVHLEFLRPTDETRPLWVATYFLSRESALDGESEADLIELALKDEFLARPGVVDAEAFSIAPGETKPIRRDPLDPSVKWIVVAAESDSQDACVRHKIDVGKKRRVELLIETEGHCLKVKRMK